MSTQVTTPAQKPLTIGSFLNFPATQKFLDDNLRERRAEFVSNLLALTDSDANLAACDPKRLMMCAMNATSLNLPLNKNLGYAYIIPYKSNGVQIPQFQIGYKGLIQLAIRTGMYEVINATDVREGEISRNKITGEITFHGEKPEAAVIGYIAYLRLKTGFEASFYMNENDIERHALRFSKMYQADKRNRSSISKWSDPEARPKMALKTVLKSLLGTYGLMTTELQKAFEADSNEEVPTDANRGHEYQEAEVIQQEEPKAPAPAQQATQQQIEI